MSNAKGGSPNDESSSPIQQPDTEATIQSPFDAALEAQIARLAPTRATVLIVGGTLDLQRSAARWLHEHSPRASAPFLAFDCAGIEAVQIELRLFGGPAHAPALDGLVQRVLGGTLYVATIEALPLLLQPRFMHFLDHERHARVVVSTASDLLQLVEQGRFRLDLAERLSLIELLLFEEGVR